MGKDYKQTALAKYKQGLVEWEEVPDGLKKKADRDNFDIGRHRADKIKRAERASKKEMRKQMAELEKGKEES